MKYELNGKVAIVIGGGGSTGSAACRMLAANGAKVVVAGRTPETLNAVVKEITAQGGTAIAVTADVTNVESMNALVDAAVRTFGRVDAMVNCAGVRGRLEKRNPLEDYEDDLWETVIATEMTGAYHIAFPPTAAASSTSAPAWNASPRPTEMEMAAFGRSTAVRKPPMRMLLPNSM